jgi:hypothetical protein
MLTFVGYEVQGKIALSEEEYEEWTWHQTKASNPEIKAFSLEVKTRIAADCLAMDQSIQILGPIGQDLWAHMGFVEFKGLVATGQAIQLAGAQTMEVLQTVLEAGTKRIAASHVKRIEA